jgi:UDP-N-acetylmuramyl pentapeptide phosphotransferase/UDP-N-acetylglucosamine-1-phosphate transferase
MDLIQSVIISLILLVILYFFFKKNSLLIDNTSFSLHKKIGNQNKSPIVLGGFYILFISLFYFKNLNFDIYLIFIMIFMIGLVSDRNIISNSLIRLIFQIFFIFLLTYLGDLTINDIRIDLLDAFLKNKTINIFFTVFCLVVLINGTNFIDGLNGLVTGYYILILLSLIFVINNDAQIFEKDFNIQFLNILFFSLIFFFAFNIFGKVYMGDSGSYLIAIIIGFYVIKFYQINYLISPYYFALLLWYPAFENLFSLLRRLKTHSKISKPDNKHFHQLVFRYFKIKKYFTEKNINPFTSIIILIFNIPSFFLGSLYSSETKILLFFLGLNITIYCLIYFKISYYFKNK